MLRFIVLGALSSEGKRLIEGVPPGAHYFLTNKQPGGGGGGEGAYQSEGGYSRKYGYMQFRAILFSRRFKVALFSRKQMKSVGAKIRQRISVEKYLYLCL